MMQSLQVPPPLPHALRSLPSRQTPSPSQQPSEQVLGPHGGGLVQVPAVQATPEPHVTQATPLVPQAAVVGGETQVVPWQQPLQFAGPQVTEATQALLKHDCGEGHTRQAIAFLPQAAVDVPGSQPASSMQPAQLPGWQVPAVQTWAAPQLEQLEARTPQALEDVPATQRPCASQQPLQFAAPQTPPSPGRPPSMRVPVHWPSEHAWPSPQTEQLTPSYPHAASPSPVWQRSLLSQHPAQL